MIWFNEHPLLRLVFIVTYLASAVWIVIKDFAWLNIIFTLLMLFGCYISFVKAGIFKDANSDSIKNFNFDILSIAITILLVIDFSLKIV